MIMKIPAPVERAALCVVAVAVAAMAYVQLVSVPRNDYCAAANLRQCTVSDSGNWVVLTTPDKHVVLLLLKDGKVVGTQQVQ